MIKDSDLRLGNLLEYGDGFISVDINVLRDLNIYLQTGLKPIAITEEWLLNAGFEKSFKNDYWYSIRIGDKRLLISILGNIEIEKWDRTMIGFLSICEYVHQLQNLYFALTGSELVFSTEP